MIAVLLRKLRHIRRNFFLAHILAQIIVEDIRLHLNEIDNAAECILLANRQLDGNCIALEAFVHHLQDIVEIGTHHVHLVDVNKTRDMIFISLSPYSFGLRLHAALGAQNCHGAVEHAQRALDFHRKVHVTRSINDIDPDALPVTGGSSGGDGNTALLLLLHPVHGGSSVVGLAESVIDTGVKQDTLGCRRLACIDVSHDANISRILK